MKSSLSLGTADGDNNHITSSKWEINTLKCLLLYIVYAYDSFYIVKAYVCGYVHICTSNGFSSNILFHTCTCTCHSCVLAYADLFCLHSMTQIPKRMHSRKCSMLKCVLLLFIWKFSCSLLSCYWIALFLLLLLFECQITDALLH